MKDLLIVGGGPAGYVGAVRAAQLGMSVALVEKEQLGGTCLNWGCIPTKVMYEAANLHRNIKKAADYGIETGAASFHGEILIKKRSQVISGLQDGIAGLLKKHAIDLLQGEFSFVDGQACIDGKQFEASKILLACGSLDDMPGFPGCDLPQVFSTRQLLALPDIPKRMVIYGGGVAGAEFGGIFASLGSEVKIIKTGSKFFPFVDEEIDKRVPTYLKRSGVQLQTGLVLKEAVEKAGILTCIFEDAVKGGEIAIETDVLLVAKGRRPNIDKLGLAEQKVATDRKGFIMVDANYQTTCAGVYAVGDVIGKRMLAHAASEEAVAAVETMNGLDASVNYQAIPNCVFMFPQIAAVGMSEQQAAAAGIFGASGKFMFSVLGRAQAEGEIDGFVKTISDRNGRIIGVHMIGPDVNELAACASTAVHTGMMVDDFSKIVQAHPTLAEALRESALAVLHKSLHS